MQTGMYVMYVCMYVDGWVGGWVGGWVVDLYTILPLTILYGIYCNKGWSRANTILRNSVCDAGGKRGAQTKVVFVKTIIDSCTQASK